MAFFIVYVCTADRNPVPEKWQPSGGAVEIHFDDNAVFRLQSRHREKKGLR
jgi:hypothetical protein